MARGVKATDRTDEIRERTCAVIAGLVISTPIEGGGPWVELRWGTEQLCPAQGVMLS